MDSSKFSIKFFLQDGASLPETVAVPLFHGWIQRQAVPGHLLIDVADYAHVKTGPGVVLVAHEGIFSTDATGGRVGLMYQRRTPLEGDAVARVKQVARIALHAAQLIEQSEGLAGRVKFRTDDPVIRVHDRLLGANDEANYAQVRAAVEAALTPAYGGALTLSHGGDAETLLEVDVRASASPSVGELLSRIS